MNLDQLTALGIFTWACAVCGAFICRLRVLQLGTHKPEVWGMNAAGGVMSAWIVVDAMTLQHADPVGLAGLLFGTLWLWTSYSTWVNSNPPKHTLIGELRSDP